MNDAALGEFLTLIFVPSSLQTGAMVISVMVGLMIYITFRDYFLQFRRKRRVGTNQPPPASSRDT